MEDLTDKRDANIDRLKMRTAMRRWRGLAFVALALVVVIGVARWGGGIGTDGPGAPHIAHFLVDGIILNNSERLHALERAIDHETARAILIEINSPGGTTSGGEELLEALTDVPEDKPVAAVIQELGASGAYMTAIGADRIFARRGSIVGSIGVLFQHTNAKGLLETIGVRFDRVTTGPLKGEPAPDDALRPEVRANLQTLVNDSYNWFVDQVAERRGLSRADTLKLADGGVLTGNLALKAGMIDALGGQKEAIDWLNEQAGTQDLRVVTYYPLPRSGLFASLSELMSVAQKGIQLGKDIVGAPRTKGLMSVWPTQ